MKKYILLLTIISLLCCKGFAQLNIPLGTQWVNIGNVTVVMNNIDLVNNGTFSSGSSSIKLTGDQNTSINGTSMPTFSILEVAKINNAKVLLGRNIGISSSINFISGLLDLNNNNILLDPAAYLAGETENSRITGTNGGFVEITQNLNAPASVNPGYLGAMITSAANLGTVTIRRGHSTQTGTGLSGSMQRYYSIIPQNNSGLNATFRFKYFDAELNGQNENILVIYQSNDNSANWINQSQSGRNTNANYVEKSGMNSFSLQTLANDVSSSPVIGLVFNATRKKPTEVQLTWTTATETNMSGYEVQRRLLNEANFSPQTFVNSKATGGNSSTALSYLYTDANSYADTSYYRLKIVDLNNNIAYSDIKSVAGKAKKGNNLITLTETNNVSVTPKVQSPVSLMTSKKITAGPNPNNGNFWFMVNGIEKETIASLYTLDGKLVKQFGVVNLQQQQVNNLRSGVYLLKVQDMDAFRIIVQGGNNSGPNHPVSNFSIIKN